MIAGEYALGAQRGCHGNRPLLGNGLERGRGVVVLDPGTGQECDFRSARLRDRIDRRLGGDPAQRIHRREIVRDRCVMRAGLPRNSIVRE